MAGVYRQLTAACLLGASCVSSCGSSSGPAGPVPTAHAAGDDAPAPMDVADASQPVADAGPAASAPAAQVPPTSSASTVADAGTDDAGAAPTPGELSIDFTTKPLLPSRTANFAPHNIVAVWMEDEQAQPVKVLAVYTSIFLPRLSTFVMHVPQYSGLGADPALRVDVIARATRHDHTSPIHLTWNLTDRNGHAVPRGRYELLIEVTDRNDRTALTRVPLSIGEQPSDQHLPDAPELGPVDLRYRP